MFIVCSDNTVDGQKIPFFDSMETPLNSLICQSELCPNIISFSYMKQTSNMKAIALTRDKLIFILFFFLPYFSCSASCNGC